MSATCAHLLFVGVLSFGSNDAYTAVHAAALVQLLEHDSQHCLCYAYCARVLQNEGEDSCLSSVLAFSNQCDEVQMRSCCSFGHPLWRPANSDTSIQ